MRTPLVIHGHFYQPPREDPWLGEIPYQESAKPHDNWNLRITRECYGANSFSRLLSGDGKIKDLINNYSLLSFNFGPTLLNWLKTKARGVYEKIIEADLISRNRNNGHGNAMAQVYNHIIMPLANHDERMTQLIWAKKDFLHHFNREPEGIWLSETAINQDTIDDIIDAGYGFTVLSPWQAEAILNPDTGKKVTFQGQPAPYSNAYYLEGKRGKLNVIFYNNVLAQGVSFEHYLRKAESFYEQLKSAKKEDRSDYLVNLATDGEIYGHHEAFGDMCVAALSRIIENNQDFYLTNYANYLAMYPPVQRAILRDGEEKRGSSWSCYHGVSRWYKDCGCSTGAREGWNQKWRTPLRDSLNFLRDQLSSAFSAWIEKHCNSTAAEARNQYISVILNPERENILTFCRKNLKPEFSSGENLEKYGEILLNFMESQKYALFMMTSCGWFFSELSGIEPKQNLAYASRAIDLAGEFLSAEIRQKFLSILKEARSNIYPDATGEDFFNDMAHSAYSDSYKAAVLVANSVFHQKQQESAYDKDPENFGFLIIDRITKDFDENNEEEKLFSGELEFHESFSLQNYSCSYIVRFINHDMEIWIQMNGKREIFKGMDMPVEIRRAIMDYLTNRIMPSYFSQIETIFLNLSETIEVGRKVNAPVPDSLKHISQTIVENYFAKFLLQRDTFPDLDEAYENLIPLCQLMSDMKFRIKNNRINKTITFFLSSLIQRLFDSWKTDEVEKFCKIIDGFRQAGFNPDLINVQNELISYLKGKKGSHKYILTELPESGLKPLNKAAAWIGIETMEILSSLSKK